MTKYLLRNFTGFYLRREDNEIEDLPVPDYHH